MKRAPRLESLLSLMTNNKDPNPNGHFALYNLAIHFIPQSWAILRDATGLGAIKIEKSFHVFEICDHAVA